MQSQKRLPQHAASVSSKKQPTVSAKPAQVRSAPVVLDQQSLRQVAGGTDAPNKILVSNPVAARSPFP